MAGRSLQASAEGIQIIRKAIKRDGWKQDELKDELGLKTRQPITRLLRGEPIERSTFEELCHLLGLHVEDVAVLEVEAISQTHTIDELVQQVRDRIHPIIQERCGTMRVLDMTQPIGLDEIYTHVNILKKITGRNRRELAELQREALQNLSPEKIERFGLGEVREKPVPGLKAVEKHRKLMILGKPGAGKTTFLKHLAMQCLGGKFQADRVPIFITLNDFAEANGTPDLLTYIDALIHSTSSPKIQPILDNGRALILLDGLDEVREIDAKRVLRQIQQFSERNADNAFVITCRIAAREYTFEKFTEVEVADFDDAQIADVSGKWFRCKQDEVKPKRFLETLKENPPIRELASSPLLLMLLCLVFEDSGDFPANRAELYQDGVDVLLKKWDSKRNIERDQVYKKLSLKRKEDMLSQIAYCTFETGNYFFKQKALERQIREFIENLPGASTDEETLNLDSEAVLKSIEAQHGLFVERAHSIYSFSHLTFHEYFAAREIKEKSYINVLSEHLIDKRWREVTLLTVGMLRDADECLLQMKRQIDRLMAEEEKLQEFLVWVDEKARSVDVPYKSTTMRIFYLAFTQNLEKRQTSHLCIRFDLKFKLDFESLYNDAYGFFSRPNDLTGDFIFLLFTNKFTNGYFNLPLSKIRLPNKNYFPGEEEDNFWTYCSGIPAYDHDYFNFYILEILPVQHYFPKDDPATVMLWGNLDDWWRINGQAWTEQFQSMLTEHRNMGHDWQFSDEQKERLQQYYDANKLLVDCLNSDCYISRSVREEIEATLLLPIAEIKQQQPL